jgi:hypothetical protein
MTIIDLAPIPGEDMNLIREAEVFATGANIHTVRSAVGLYRNAITLVQSLHRIITAKGLTTERAADYRGRIEFVEKAKARLQSVIAQGRHGGDCR